LKPELKIKIKKDLRMEVPSILPPPSNLNRQLTLSFLQEGLQVDGYGKIVVEFSVTTSVKVCRNLNWIAAGLTLIFQFGQFSAA
jgi:hypothetical protein